MANFVLLIAVLLAGASFVSFTAQDIAAAGYGQSWASDFCWAAPLACQRPASNGLRYGRIHRALDFGEIRLGASRLED
jgi:hypothetical protein